MSALNTGGLINTGRTMISYAIINQVLSSLTSELYHDLIHYFKYASSAYSPVCPQPNGKKLIMPVRDSVQHANKLSSKSPEISFPTFRETSKDMLPVMMIDTKSSSHFGEGNHWRNESQQIIISWISVSILTWIADASLILVPFIASGAKVQCRYSRSTSIGQLMDFNSRGSCPFRISIIVSSFKNSLKATLKTKK